MIIKHFSPRIGKGWVKRFYTVLTAVFVAIAISFSAPATVLAAPTMMADMSDVQQKAKETFDDVFGSGASDRVEGNIDQSTGELKKQAGKIKGQLDDDMTAGMGDRIEGQFDRTMGAGKKQMGKVKGRVEDAFNQADMMGEKKPRSIESVIEEKSDY